MRALVTGAAGFIGSNVVRALLERGHDVRAMTLPGEDTRNLRGLGAAPFEGDVTDAESVERAVRGVDVVFHLAAVFSLWDRDSDRMHRVNVEGTRIVLAAARRAGTARVVHTSSIARFGGQGRGVRATEHDAYALGPTGDVYAQTKRDAHEVAVDAAREQDVVIVAPCGPIGPGDVGPTPTGRLLVASLTMPVAVSADTVTCFGDVRDMAVGHVLAAERGRRGETYLLGTEDLSMQEVARVALDAAGRSAPLLTVPLGVARFAGHVAERVARRTARPPLLTAAAARIAALELRADCTKSHDELGVPRSPVRAAIVDAVAWFEREGYLARARPGARALRFAAKLARA
jgi:dihydroflavonol-4-reductase